jgi:transposase
LEALLTVAASTGSTKKAVVVLSLTLRLVEIARLMGVHANAVRNIIKLWRTTGQVTQAKESGIGSKLLSYFSFYLAFTSVH